MAPDIDYLSQFDLLQIRTRLQALERQPFDLLSPPALQSALAAPRQSSFGEEMYQGVTAKAAILFHRLIKNHPFYDGNKRIAAEALRTFLQRNGALLAAPDDEVIGLARRVALGGADEDAIRLWVEARAEA